jgi:hypothetical protein
MTIEQQTTLIGFEKLNALDVLVTLIPNFQLTGSISLLAYGVNERKIEDIDIVVNSFACVEHIGKSYNLSYTFDYTDDIEQVKELHPHKVDGHLKYLVPNRAHMVVHGVKVCIFVGKNQECQFFEFMNERKFKISHPIYAIEAKKKYLDDLYKMEKLNHFQYAKMSKHSMDVANYLKWENDQDKSDLPF